MQTNLLFFFFFFQQNSLFGISNHLTDQNVPLVMLISNNHRANSSYFRHGIPLKPIQALLLCILFRKRLNKTEYLIFFVCVLCFQSQPFRFLFHIECVYVFVCPKLTYKNSISDLEFSEVTDSFVDLLSAISLRIAFACQKIDCLLLLKENSYTFRGSNLVKIVVPFF